MISFLNSGDDALTKDINQKEMLSKLQTEGTEIGTLQLSLLTRQKCLITDFELNALADALVFPQTVRFFVDTKMCNTYTCSNPIAPCYNLPVFQGEGCQGGADQDQRVSIRRWIAPPLKQDELKN